MMDGRDDPGTEVAIIGMAGRFPGARICGASGRTCAAGSSRSPSSPTRSWRRPGSPRSCWPTRATSGRAAVLEGRRRCSTRRSSASPRARPSCSTRSSACSSSAPGQALEDAGYDPDRYPGRDRRSTPAAASARYLCAQPAAEPGGCWPRSAASRRCSATTRTSSPPASPTSSTCAARASPCRPPARPRWSRSTSPARPAPRRVRHGARRRLVGRRSRRRRATSTRTASILSPDGHCRAFDAAAAGTVGGNGVGVVVLKRLADALRRRRPIHAVIRGSAVNNDGCAKVGFTAPGVEGQAEVIAERPPMAGVEPGAHRLRRGARHRHAARRPDRGRGADPGVPRARPTSAASAPSARSRANIGHLRRRGRRRRADQGGAGARARRDPAERSTSRRPNPQIDFAASPFYVNTELRPWPADGRPRRAGVQLVRHRRHQRPRGARGGAGRSRRRRRRGRGSCCCSRRAPPTALEAATERLAAHLEAHPGEELADVAHTLQVGRQGFEHRRALVARGAEDAAAALDGESRPAGSTAGGRGDGGTGRSPSSSPAWATVRRHGARPLPPSRPFREAARPRCRALLPGPRRSTCASCSSPAGEPAAPRRRGGGQARPAALLAAEPRRPGAGRRADRGPRSPSRPSSSSSTRSPELLRPSGGSRPEAMIGYSLGEYIAACLAGVFSLDDAPELVARAGAADRRRSPAGAMLAVPLPEAEVAPLLPASTPQLSAVRRPTARHCRWSAARPRRSRSCRAGSRPSGASPAARSRRRTPSTPR